MQCFQGKSVYKGIVLGPVVVLRKNDYQVKRTKTEDPEAEIGLVQKAIEDSKEQLHINIKSDTTYNKKHNKNYLNKNALTNFPIFF